MALYSSSRWMSFLSIVVVTSLVLGGLERKAFAVRILMVGGAAGSPNNGDVGTYAILTAEYDEALELGDEGVFYMQGSASAPEDADLVDIVFISSTLGSGTVRNKFEDTTAAVLNHEQALMPDSSGNFFMSTGAQTSAGHTQLDILEPDHPLAAGLDGTVDVFTEPHIMSVGNGVLAPGVIAIAQTTNDANLQGIFAAELEAELLGNGSDGSPATAWKAWSASGRKSCPSIAARQVSCQ